MADYIYLLEHRLSTAQQNALKAVRDLARLKSLTVFLVGGAVRDLTSGSPVRDLDLVVQGNALKLRKDIEQIATLVGESVSNQALFARFSGGVRMEIASTLSISYPKPGKAVATPANILDDLRRRDFTANAMAISLNDGSYGLLMDPLNGVADIENRELRLVSNYGFIEDPIRMIRAIRLGARLGWQMDEKTQARYETGKEEGYISAASDYQLGYEAEEIVHEEDPLRVLRRLESEGWMKFLAPNWTAAKANVQELEKMRASQTQLQLQGIHPDPSAGNFPLLTAKMSANETAELKKRFPRQGFVAQIESLDREAKEFAAALTAKTAVLPSQAWKLIHAAQPEAVLAVAYTTKSAPILAKLNSFYTEWPQARQRIPYVQMQEMRIHPELPGYADLVEALVFELMDGKLTTPEEIKAYLEPFSPPAPPPPVHLRRARAAKKEAKPAKSRAKKAAASGEPTDFVADPTSPDGTFTPAAADASLPAVAASSQVKKKPAAASKPVAQPVAQPAARKAAAAPVSSRSIAVKSTAQKQVTAPKSATKAKPSDAKATQKTASKPAAKPAAKTAVQPVSNGSAKAATKPAAKPAAKSAAKSAAKPAAKPNHKSGIKPNGTASAKAGTKPAAKKPLAKASSKSASPKPSPAAKSSRPAQSAKTNRGASNQPVRAKQVSVTPALKKSVLVSKAAAKAPVKKTAAKLPTKPKPAAKTASKPKPKPVAKKPTGRR